MLHPCASAFVSSCSARVNKSPVLAHVLARETGVPVESLACARTRETATQTGLAAQQRKHNIKGAFATDGKILKKYSHVTINDDVVTTGSTVTELASALYRAGIMQIDVWACARATIF